jgi:hypothetical protein
MKATKDEIETLLARHHIAPPETAGTSSKAAASGGRLASLSIERRDDSAIMSLAIGNALAEAPAPKTLEGARAIVAKVRTEASLGHDPSFEHMLAELLLRASEMFEESEATRLDFTPLHVHPTSYHIGEVTLFVEKPLHLRARLEPDSHDRRAVFDHRHGDSVKFPK